MLIESSRIKPEDMKRWKELERFDQVLSKSSRLTKLEEKSRAMIREFLSKNNSGYAGISWGKDSTCLAHLVSTEYPEYPMIHIIAKPIDNPDCPLVRDAFLSKFNINYHEIVVDYSDVKTDIPGEYTKDIFFDGFDIAANRFGDRYITGLRADESSGRKMFAKSYKGKTNRVCAPLIQWSGVFVFAYLKKYDLPIHPAYACSMNGALDRCKIRVDVLGDEPGIGMGRRIWEHAYYPELVTEQGHKAEL